MREVDAPRHFGRRTWLQQGGTPPFTKDAELPIVICNQPMVETVATVLGCFETTRHIIFIEDLFIDAIAAAIGAGRAATKPNSDNDAPADIGTAPPSASGIELFANFEIAVFHGGLASHPIKQNPRYIEKTGCGISDEAKFIEQTMSFPIFLPVYSSS
jgi:hypothetical protein